jgi:heme/copper-type cytochrome/quinol oxidase subunit 1
MSSTDAAPAARPPSLGWLTSGDHKPIGIAYLVTALLFLLVALGAALAIRIETVSDGLQVVDRDSQGQLFTLYATAAFFLGLLPAWLGIAVHVVPLQIGARRIAFARMQAFALWLFVGGGVVAVVSFLVDGGPSAAEALLLPPGPFRGGEASDLWLLGMGAVTLATTLTAANLVVTVVTLRAPGMNLSRAPVFSVAALVGGAVTVLAAPVFAAGLILHGVNLGWTGTFWQGDVGVSLWQKVLSLAGRPELFVPLILGVGALAEIAQVMGRRPLLDRRAVLGGLGATGALSFLVWAYERPDIAAAPLAPHGSPVQAAAFVPLALAILVCLGTVARGRPRISAALVTAVFGVLALGLAGLGAASAVVVDVQAGTDWATGHFDLLFLAAPLLFLVAALAYWAPKMWGRAFHEGLASLSGLALFIGAVVACGSFYLGLRDTARYSLDAAPGSDVAGWYGLAFAGVIVIGLGLLALLANLARVALRGGATGEADPWGGGTLEWLAASPPPGHNFEPDTLPAIRSDRPLADLRAGSGGA